LAQLTFAEALTLLCATSFRSKEETCDMVNVAVTGRRRFQDLWGYMYQQNQDSGFENHSPS
jgi:hypothetical protein